MAVLTARLVEQVREHWTEDREPVTHRARGPGQVDDEGALGEPGQAPREDRGRHAVRRTVGADRLCDAGDLAGDHRPGGLRREVVRREPGAPGGDDDGIATEHRRPQDLFDRDAVRDHVRPVHLEAQGTETLRKQRPAPVDARGAGNCRRDRDGQRAPSRHERCQSADVPPVLLSTWIRAITAAGSTALTMSISARAATATQVSASISTPVRSAVRTVASMSTPSSTTERPTSTPWMAMGWHSGTSSGVRLAAWMPAMRATASASPLGTPPPRKRSTTAAESSTWPDAVAVRAVTGLPLTSTMRAAPRSSRCVNPSDMSSVGVIRPAVPGP